MEVYDLETFNTDRAVPNAVCIYKLTKNIGKCNRDKTQREFEKCRKVCIVFKATSCNNEKLDYVLELKREAKKINNKIVKFNLYMILHSGCGCDSCVVLNNLPQL